MPTSFARTLMGSPDSTIPLYQVPNNIAYAFISIQIVNTGNVSSEFNLARSSLSNPRNEDLIEYSTILDSSIDLKRHFERTNIIMRKNDKLFLAGDANANNLALRISGLLYVTDNAEAKIDTALLNPNELKIIGQMPTNILHAFTNIQFMNLGNTEATISGYVSQVDEPNPRDFVLKDYAIPPNGGAIILTHQHLQQGERVIGISPNDNVVMSTSSILQYNA